MPDADVMQMEAGRDLDALVADALGYKAYKETRGDFTLCVVRAPQAREPWQGSRTPAPQRYTEVSCLEAVRIGFFGVGFPAFSTDIAAAWLVVEHLRGRDVYLDVGAHRGGYDCEAGWSGNDWEEVYVDAPTAPLAICRAALLAHAEGAVLREGLDRTRDEGRG